MDKKPKERRKHVRIKRHFIHTYHEKGKPRPIYNISQINNVSKGGLSFSSTHPLKQGAVIVIVLKAPFIGDNIHLEGLVLECKEKIPEIIYEVRLQFQEIPRHVLTVLEKIEKYSKSKDG